MFPRDIFWKVQRIMTKLLFEIIREELCDVVGEDGVDTSEAGRFCYGADYSWVSRAWVDRGWLLPFPITWSCQDQPKRSVGF